MKRTSERLGPGRKAYGHQKELLPQTGAFLGASAEISIHEGSGMSSEDAQCLGGPPSDPCEA
jgi:hypothetical protein